MNLSVFNHEMKGEEFDDEYVLSNTLLFELILRNIHS